MKAKQKRLMQITQNAELLRAVKNGVQDKQKQLATLSLQLNKKGERQHFPRFFSET